MDDRILHARSLALVCALAAALTAPARAADPARYLPPPGASYGAEEVRVRGIGCNCSLGGTLTAPRDGRRRHPAVVLIAGGAPRDRDGDAAGETARPFYWIADSLARRGISVLRLDDRGTGASAGADFANAATRALDVRAALEYLHRRPDVDDRRLGLIGFGDGGGVAAGIAADESLLAGIVTLGSADVTPLVPERVPLLTLHDIAGAGDGQGPSPGALGTMVRWTAAHLAPRPGEPELPAPPRRHRRARA